jgi:hypothetical protein
MRTESLEQLEQQQQQQQNNVDDEQLQQYQASTSRAIQNTYSFL